MTPWTFNIKFPHNTQFSTNCSARRKLDFIAEIEGADDGDPHRGQMEAAGRRARQTATTRARRGNVSVKERGN
jgi:hypothetical protein